MGSAVLALIIINALNKFISMKAQQKEKQSAQSRAIQSVLSKQLHRLVELWLSNSVDDGYQARVMNYLDQFESKDVQLRQIKKQIELTLKKQSPYFMIHHLVEEKEQLLNALEKEMRNLEQYCSQNNEEEPDLQPVCNILNGLRQSQMLIVESVMQMAQKYKIKRDNGNTKNEYVDLIAGFSEDLCFLKESVLKYYIPFRQQFDPLFVQEAKFLKKRYKENSIVYNKSVEKLLTLQPSYMYRLLRAKKNMEELISVSKSKGFEELNNRQVMDYDEVSAESQGQLSEEENKLSKEENKSSLEKSQVNQTSTYDYQKFTKDQSKKLVLCFKLDNSAYVSQNKVKSRANTRNETINAYQQKYSKIEKERQAKQFERNRTLQIQPQSKPRQEYYNRRIQRQPIEIPLQKEKERQVQRLKISPPILKIDIRSQIKNRKESVHTKRSIKSRQKQPENHAQHREIKVFKEEGTQHSQIQIISKNKKFYLLQLQKDSKIIEQGSYPGLKRKKQPFEIPNPTSIRQRIQHKPNQQVSPNVRRQIQQKAASKKHKNFISADFDYLGNEEFQRNEMQYKATHKNFLRGIPRGLKGKNKMQPRDNEGDFQSKKLEVDRQQIEQEDSLHQKQREIIAKINRKYKLLAMKQKQYQLSKLGHIIYHRMRQKQLNSRFKAPPKKKEYLS